MTNRVYDFALANVVGASQRIDAAGTYFKLLSASAGRVAVRVDGGNEVTLQPGQGFRLTDRSQPVRDVVVRNLDAQLNSGSLFVGDWSFEDSRIFGIVEVMDTRAVRTRQGVAYSWRYTATGAVGQYPAVSMVAPANRRIVINGLSLGSSIAGGVSWGVRALSVGVAGPANVLPQNKLSGGPASLVTVNAVSSAALYGGTGVEAADSAFMQASDSRDLFLQEPIVLQPGHTFVIGGESTGQQIAGRIEFYEETP